MYSNNIVYIYYMNVCDYVLFKMLFLLVKKKYNHQKKTLKIESLFNSHGFGLLSLTNFLFFQFN